MDQLRDNQSLKPFYHIFKLKMVSGGLVPSACFTLVHYCLQLSTIIPRYCLSLLIFFYDRHLVWFLSLRYRDYSIVFYHCQSSLTATFFTDNQIWCVLPCDIQPIRCLIACATSLFITAHHIKATHFVTLTEAILHLLYNGRRNLCPYFYPFFSVFNFGWEVYLSSRASSAISLRLFLQYCLMSFTIGTRCGMKNIVVSNYW